MCHNLPFPACFTEQAEKIVVEHILVTIEYRALDARLSARWRSRLAANKRPRALNAKLIGDKDDLLLQSLLDRDAKSGKDLGSLGGTFFRSVNLLGIDRRGKSQEQNENEESHLFT